MDSDIKVVILAGGFGTRISEESHLKPKPMIEIGGQPILWHIMKIYSSYGFNDFIICLGYKGIIIKEYFSNYFLHTSDITFDFRDSNKITYHNHYNEPWRVTLVDTGLESMTGGRVKRIQPFIGNNPFMLTYGDGVANININELLKHHQKHNKYVTVTAVQPLGKFGSLTIDNNESVKKFREKPKGDGAWVNGGFFVMQPEIFNYIEHDSSVLENGIMERLSNNNQLSAFRFNGFWQPMDTMRDKNYLEELWKAKKAPWKTWE
jgi:glucose-1-phosphate cytidylyltransferase